MSGSCPLPPKTCRAVWQRLWKALCACHQVHPHLHLVLLPLPGPSSMQLQRLLLPVLIHLCACTEGGQWGGR